MDGFSSFAREGGIDRASKFNDMSVRESKKLR